MHEPKASALRHRDRYYIVRVRHIKTRSPAKCVINILWLIASPTANHVPSRICATASQSGLSSSNSYPKVHIIYLLHS